VYLTFICSVAGMGGFLFGFDSIVISGTIPQLKSDFQLSAAAEGFYVSASLLGCMVAAPIAGVISDRWGRRNLLFAAAFLTSFATLLCAMAQSAQTLIIARLVCGLGVGSASMVCPLYIAEVSPQALRGRLVTIYQFAITIGICISLFSNAALNALASQLPPGGEDSWKGLFQAQTWRFMIGSQLLPSASFLILCLFIPESPRWLYRAGRQRAAFDVLKKINSLEAANTIYVDLEDSLRRERVHLAEAPYRLLWERYRKPMLMALFLGVVSELSGITVVFYYGPTILHDAGFELGGALSGFAAIGLVNMVTTVIALWLIDRIGRRPLLLVGTIGAIVCLIAIGICFTGLHSASNVAVLAICGFVAFYAFSIGPIKFVVASELFPTALRAKAVATFIFAVFTSGALVNQLFPLVRDHWGVPASFYCFAAILVPQVLFAWAFLPETAGQTLEHLDQLFPGEQKGLKGVQP
jgi:sugar porter (SP) family MFS transporter